MKSIIKFKPLAAFALVCTCLFNPGQMLAALEQDIVVHSPYVNALIPGQHTTAGYFTLENQGDTVLTLVGVETEVAQSASLHQSLEHDGMMHMEGRSELSIPPGAQITFEPGGYHIMLVGIQAALLPGTVVPMTLVFDDGQTYPVSFRVRDRFN